MSGVFTVLIGLGVLGLMVVIHEWGHYLAARYFKVRVLTFSVGFGPRLFGVRRGDTDFCVRAIPLGGYVKMAGENPFEERENAPDEFYSKPRWQRSIIAFAGPLINIIFAVLLLTGLYMFEFRYPSFLRSKPVVATVAVDSPAARAGVQPGDEIVSIDGEAVPDWESLNIRILLTAGEKLAVRVERNAAPQEFSLVPEPLGKDGETFVGWAPASSIVLGEITPGMPAESAGLKAGDEIIAFNGKPLEAWARDSFAQSVRGSNGEEFSITVLRGGNMLEARMSAVRSEIEGTEVYAIGVSMGEKTTTTQLGFSAALTQSVRQNWDWIRLMGRLARRLIVGRSSFNQMQGPIGIVNLAGQAADLGLGSLTMFMALISINLGVLNLLPIPILDGGHITMFAVEGMIRRDLSLRLKERFLQFGFLVLMMLFAVVMYNDIVRYFFR